MRRSPPPPPDRPVRPAPAVIDRQQHGPQPGLPGEAGHAVAAEAPDGHDPAPLSRRAALPLDVSMPWASHATHAHPTAPEPRHSRRGWRWARRGPLRPRSPGGRGSASRPGRGRAGRRRRTSWPGLHALAPWAERGQPGRTNRRRPGAELTLDGLDGRHPRRRGALGVPGRGTAVALRVGSDRGQDRSLGPVARIVLVAVLARPTTQARFGGIGAADARPAIDAGAVVLRLAAALRAPLSGSPSRHAAGGQLRSAGATHTGDHDPASLSRRAASAVRPFSEPGIASAAIVRSASRSRSRSAR